MLCKAQKVEHSARKCQGHGFEFQGMCELIIRTTKSQCKSFGINLPNALSVKCKYDHTFNLMISDRRLRTHWEIKKKMLFEESFILIKSSLKAFSHQKCSWKAKRISFGSFAFNTFPLLYEELIHSQKINSFVLLSNWFGVNRWKGMHYFYSKSWFHWMLMDIFAFDLNRP